jgi:hypothetical protein
MQLQRRRVHDLPPAVCAHTANTSTVAALDGVAAAAAAAASGNVTAAQCRSVCGLTYGSHLLHHVDVLLLSLP